MKKKHIINIERALTFFMVHFICRNDLGGKKNTMLMATQTLRFISLLAENTVFF